MRTNPFADFFAFLTGPSYSEPSWLHYIYWILAAASIAVAVTAWRLPATQTRLVDIERFAIRFLLASFWWQQSLWKFPTDTGGLRYWTEQEVAHPAFKFIGELISTLVLPIFQPFACGVYAFEVLVAATLFLGFRVRVFSGLGTLLIVNLFLGLYQAPQEWPWSYVFLIVLMVIMAVEDYGQSLGMDAVLAAQNDRDGATIPASPG